jgi:integrase
MGNLLKTWVIRYLDPDGRQVRKGTRGARKVREKSSKWYGQYTDADGVRRRVPLSTDKTAARQELARLEREAEHGKVGLTDPHAEAKTAPIAEHIAAYEVPLKKKSKSPKHRAETLRRLRAVLTGAKVRTLGGLYLDPVEAFLVGLVEGGASARTANTYRTSVKAFTRWCVKSKRLPADPLATLDPAKGDQRRQRRALNDGELDALLRVANRRPLDEAMLIRRGKRKGQLAGRVKPAVRERLERLGRERALMYKVMVLTGLRRGELASVRVRDIDFGARPRIELPGSATKNDEVASLPLRPDLASELGQWIAENGKGAGDRVFRVPVELVKILKRDLKAAGIAYRDDRGRTVDVHALRHTTATHLARAKVAPRVAQQFMRHSDIKLTMQVYTDLQLLDETEALAALPDMKLDGAARTEGQGRGAIAG